jgi:acyl-CoA hydrolase
MPSSTSYLDNRVWGGELLHKLDGAAFTCAFRHSCMHVTPVGGGLGMGGGGEVCGLGEESEVEIPNMAPPVTAAIDDVIFERPVRVGQVMTMTACLTRVWGSSMEVEVRVEGEDIMNPEWGRWPVLNVSP